VDQPFDIMEGLIDEFAIDAACIAGRTFTADTHARRNAPRGEPRETKGFACVWMHKGGAVYAAFSLCQARNDEIVTSTEQVANTCQINPARFTEW
jgi:hypothetical protein